PPPPDCTSQADCDNGSFCDGVETCVAGSCLSGSPVVCDDGIACTVDSCNETADACSQTPSNALCSNGLFCDGVEACSPIVGCEAGIAPCSGSDLCNETIDACVPDGGGGPVRYRSNAGGPTLPATDGGIDWIGGSPADAGLATVANVSSTGETVAWSSSEPPAALFRTEVWDNAGGDEMRWEFSVPPGNYEVRIYFAEIYGGTFGNGLRVFDVLVEGAVVLDDYDIFSLYGALAGAVEVVSTSVTDGSLTIEFIHGVENPKVAGFEIIDLATSDPDADGDGVTVGEGDCNDADPNVRPGVSDPCDGVDNDCDGAFDEDYVSLPTQCGVGACEATGATVCDALSSTEIDTCTPGTPAPDDSSCDGVDSDCDGVVDEDCVVVPSIKAETGVALANDTSWTTVNLSNDYSTGMVVVSTPVHVPGSPPYVARVRNASGSAFEMQLAIAGPTGSPVSSEVHYFVVEEGVYDEATYGVQLEAVKYLSTVTDSRSGWVGETRTYAQTYGSPVVVGQVMSANDPEESVFWARGSSRTNPPNATNLVTGKAVNEDPNTTRVNETVGYVVVEAGSGAIAGLNFQALLGSDTVRGVSNSPPYRYTLGALSGASVAVTSLAGLDGNNGGWAMLYGPLDSSGAAVDLVVEEDALQDSERSHTTEQLSVIVFE
ncbi:MAG: malectin domain-containing carbohydrate-binding protein, partial [Myxococcota bacterium]